MNPLTSALLFTLEWIERNGDNPSSQTATSHLAALRHHVFNTIGAATVLAVAKANLEAALQDGESIVTTQEVPGETQTTPDPVL